MTCRTIPLLLLSLTSACATVFTGSARVEGGRAGCEHKCKAQGMELAAMVYMGEYSDACVCQLPGAAMTPVAAAGAVAGGASGVNMQMVRQQQQQ